MTRISIDRIAREVFLTGSRRSLMKGMAAGLGLGLMQLEDADAKKTNGQKRCKKLGDHCTPGGKRKCCKSLKWRGPFDPGVFRCCIPLKSECTDGDKCFKGACAPF